MKPSSELPSAGLSGKIYKRKLENMIEPECELPLPQDSPELACFLLFVLGMLSLAEGCM